MQTIVEKLINRRELEDSTGELFGSFWGPYDDVQFKHSVDLFFRRLELAGVSKDFFKDKVCLDAGCGGGRNSIAMSMSGASFVEGIDLGSEGLIDAQKRAEALKIENIKFQKASVLDIPFEDNHFDSIWCAGVIMITQNPTHAIKELTRVLKPGGNLYLLIYATEGIRWPLINLLRPFSAIIGRSAFEEAFLLSGEPTNKRRTFFDDLFCPKLDFFSYERVERELRYSGITGNIERWGEEARIDHEESLETYQNDLQSLLNIIRGGIKIDSNKNKTNIEYFKIMENIIHSTIEGIKIRAKDIGKDNVDSLLIGQGHHRVLCVK